MLFAAVARDVGERPVSDPVFSGWLAEPEPHLHVRPRFDEQRVHPADEFGGYSIWEEDNPLRRLDHHMSCSKELFYVQLWTSTPWRRKPTKMRYAVGATGPTV